MFTSRAPYYTITTSAESNYDLKCTHACPTSNDIADMILQLFVWARIGSTYYIMFLHVDVMFVSRNAHESSNKKWKNISIVIVTNTKL